MQDRDRRNGKGTQLTRKGRSSGRNQIYHVTSTTVDREPVLAKFDSGRVVVRAMRREDQAAHTRTLAFVIMPDHFHWLFQLAGDRSLSRCVNSVKSWSTRQINTATERQGSLWQRGFYDRAIRREEDLDALARYIVANPVRAGIVRRVRDYPLWDAVWV